VISINSINLSEHFNLSAKEVDLAKNFLEAALNPDSNIRRLTNHLSSRGDISKVENSFERKEIDS